MPARAVFLDRDGILNEPRPDPVTGELEGPLSVSDVALMADVAASIGQLRAAGYLLIGVTNQPAAAKGRISLVEQGALHQRVLDLLEATGASLDGWRVCPHHPEAALPALRVTCDCRKPAPGMLLDAAREFDIDLGASWMIGDSDSDVEAGRAAGVRTVLVGAENGHKRQRPERADVHAASLTEAVAALFIES